MVSVDEAAVRETDWDSCRSSGRGGGGTEIGKGRKGEGTCVMIIRIAEWKRDLHVPLCTYGSRGRNGMCKVVKDVRDIIWRVVCTRMCVTLSAVASLLPAPSPPPPHPPPPLHVH